MLTLSQVLIGTSASKVCSIPPGPCTVVVSIGSTTGITPAEVVYLGTSAGVTTTNGVPLNSGQTITLPIPAGSAASALYAISTVASTPVGFAISAPN